MTTGFIDELSDYDKDPRFVGQTLFGQGSVSQGRCPCCLWATRVRAARSSRTCRSPAA